MTTHVWVVERECYDAYSALAVFSSLESAQAAYPGEWYESSQSPGFFYLGDLCVSRFDLDLVVANE